MIKEKRREYLKRQLLKWNLEEKKWYRYGEACRKANKDPNADNTFEIYNLLEVLLKDSMPFLMD